MSSDVSEAGSATVDGVQTTQYLATITPQDQLRMHTRTGVTDPSPWDTDPTATDPAYLPTLHLHIWIDVNGLVRRCTLDADGVLGGRYDGTDGSTGTSQVTKETGVIHMSFDLLTVNQPVHIEIPPPDQVADRGDGCGSTMSTTSASSDSSVDFTCIGSSIGSGIAGATMTTSGN